MARNDGQHSGTPASALSSLNELQDLLADVPGDPQAPMHVKRAYDELAAARGHPEAIDRLETATRALSLDVQLKLAVWSPPLLTMRAARAIQNAAIQQISTCLLVHARRMRLHPPGDHVQEALVLLLPSLEDFECRGKGPAIGYLRRTLLSAQRRLSQPNAGPHLPVVNFGGPPPEPMLDARAALGRIRHGLTVDECQLLLLAETLTLKEIAASEGVSANQVRKRLTAARRKACRLGDSLTSKREPR